MGSLIETNPFLRNEIYRKLMIEQFVMVSSAIEGVKLDKKRLREVERLMREEVAKDPELQKAYKDLRERFKNEKKTKKKTAH